MPDSQLTLTHFDDRGRQDESVLKETAKSRNLNYQSWQDVLEQKLTDTKMKRKKQLGLSRVPCIFLEPSESHLMERNN